MLPRRVLASVTARSAATVLVTATLALAGCKIETSGSDPGSGASGAASGSAATAVPSGPGTAGAIYDMLNEDKRKAIEIIVEEKAEATDPETADGNLPELESPGRPRT